MGGMWLGVQFDDYVGVFLQFSCTQRDESEVPALVKVPILVYSRFPRNDGSSPDCADLHSQLQ